MPSPQKQLSDIQESFKDSTIFLTGGTGFIGELLLEKILRSLDVKRIYMLIRTKKGVAVEDRLEQLFDVPLFDLIRKNNINYKEKIRLITGDLQNVNLAISQSDRALIINEVDYIFHCAATVKFDETLDVATKINVRATRDLLEIGKQVKNLKAFVYVSTAYSNSNRKDIDEKFYPPPIDAHKLINTMESLEGKNLEGLTKDLLGDDFNNTYIFTKNVTESLVKSEGANLPICIARPSIVMGTANEPLRAYIDSYGGLSGVLVGIGMGIIRVLHVPKNLIMDFMPGDYVVNNIIACGWYTGTKGNFDVNGKITSENNVPIFNVISSADNPVDALILFEYIRSDCWTMKALWCPDPKFITCYYDYKIREFFTHTTMAYLADFGLWITGRKTWIIKKYHHVQSLIKLTQFFYSTTFHFSNANNRELYAMMSNRDKKIFNIDLKTLDWEGFLSGYLKGIRVYLMKDPMSTLPEANKLWRKYKFYENCAYTIFGLLFLYLLYIIVF